MKRLLGAACVLSFVFTAAAAHLACEDTSPDVPCVTPIPPGGCPTDNGADVCSDPSCDAVFRCTNGNWVLDRTCGLREAGAESGSDVDAGADARHADVSVDAPPGAFGGPGCIDLQPPDCALGAALECGGAADCCGCQDLFVCVDGGWNPWGECVDGGVVASGP